MVDIRLIFVIGIKPDIREELITNIKFKMMKKTILVIDDFETSVFVLASTLKSNNYNVITANSAEAALKQLNGQQVDMVITDYNMPNMNGLDLVDKIKKYEIYKRIPIFVLSTETNKEVKDRAKNSGVTAWVKKPFKVDQLLGLIKRVL